MVLQRNRTKTVIIRESPHIIMQAEKSQDPQSTSQRYRRANSIVSFVIKGLRTRDTEGVSSSLRAED